MDAFEYNKITGAVLSALLIICAGRVIRDTVWTKPRPEKPGWVLPVTEVEPSTQAPPPAAAFDPAQVIAQLGHASPDNGREIFKRCLQCHTSEKGGPNRIGPNLWGIVGRPRASQPGFPYSDAMKNHHENWTFEELAKYLHDPKSSIPGNKMAFVGIKNNTDLADLLAYLRTLSGAPPALPE